MNRYNGEVEREMLKNMSNRERAEYNARKRMSQPKNDDWDDDDDDDKFDTSWLDAEDEKLQASR